MIGLFWDIFLVVFGSGLSALLASEVFKKTRVGKVFPVVQVRNDYPIKKTLMKSIPCVLGFPQCYQRTGYSWVFIQRRVHYDGRLQRF